MGVFRLYSEFRVEFCCRRDVWIYLYENRPDEDERAATVKGLRELAREHSRELAVGFCVVCWESFFKLLLFGLRASR